MVHSGIPRSDHSIKPNTMSEVIEETATTTLQDYVDLYNALEGMQDLQGLRFAQKIADNLDRLINLLQPLNMALKPSPEFEQFAQRVREEAQGDPAKVKMLEDAHPELINERRSQIEAGQILLSEPAKLTLRRIHQNELPSNISARQIRGLSMILDK